MSELVDLELGTMATSTHCELIKLNGDNYPAWQLQLRMALVRDDLWGIVNGSEAAEGEAATADGMLSRNSRLAAATK